MSNASRLPSSPGTCSKPKSEELPAAVRKCVASLRGLTRGQLTGLAKAVTVEAERRAVAS